MVGQIVSYGPFCPAHPKAVLRFAENNMQI